MLAASIIFKLAMGIFCFYGQIPTGDSKISLPSHSKSLSLTLNVGIRVMEWPHSEWCYVDLSVSSNKVQKKGIQGLDTSIFPLVRIRPQGQHCPGSRTVLLVCEAPCSFDSVFLSDFKSKVPPSFVKMSVNFQNMRCWL